MLMRGEEWNVQRIKLVLPNYLLFDHVKVDKGHLRLQVQLQRTDNGQDGIRSAQIDLDRSFEMQLISVVHLKFTAKINQSSPGPSRRSTSMVRLHWPCRIRWYSNSLSIYAPPNLSAFHINLHILFVIFLHTISVWCYMPSDENESWWKPHCVEERQLDKFQLTEWSW